MAPHIYTYKWPSIVQFQLVPCRNLSAKNCVIYLYDIERLYTHIHTQSTQTTCISPSLYINEASKTVRNLVPTILALTKRCGLLAFGGRFGFRD